MQQSAATKTAFVLLNRLFGMRSRVIPRLEQRLRDAQGKALLAAKRLGGTDRKAARKQTQEAERLGAEIELLEQFDSFVEDLIRVAETQQPTAEDALRNTKIPSFTATEPMSRSQYALFRGRSYADVLRHMLTELLRLLKHQAALPRDEETEAQETFMREILERL